MAATFAAAYGATKSAMVNLTVSLAKGLARAGVTANTVSPGPVLTPNIEARIKDVAGKEGWHGEWAEVENRFVADFFANLASIIGPRSFLDLAERRCVAEFFENPTGRIGRVAEVVDLVIFIASPRATLHQRGQPPSGRRLRADDQLNRAFKSGRDRSAGDQP